MRTHPRPGPPVCAALALPARVPASCSRPLDHGLSAGTAMRQAVARPSVLSGRVLWLGQRRATRRPQPARFPWDGRPQRKHLLVTRRPPLASAPGPSRLDGRAPPSCGAVALAAARGPAAVSFACWPDEAAPYYMFRHNERLRKRRPSSPPVTGSRAPGPHGAEGRRGAGGHFIGEPERRRFPLPSLFCGLAQGVPLSPARGLLLKTPKVKRIDRPRFHGLYSYWKSESDFHHLQSLDEDEFAWGMSSLLFRVKSAWS